MGKIADALEKRQKETVVKSEPESRPVDEKTVAPDSETAAARQFCSIHNCSEKVVVLSQPESVEAEQFRLLRAQILFSEDRKRPRLMMITSTLPGEGKTFVSANLAVSIAMGIDEYVLLIDCDLRRPHLHEYFGLNNTEGLHEYLAGIKPLTELIIHTEIEKLSILPAGKTPKNPTELLSSTRMEAFLEEVKGRYPDRFIVIDATPSQITAEANILARYVDGIILVVMAQKSPRKSI
ncbi:MAG: CpsD/CapB family tyrosine-protein kinase, partial [Deltaproteobacteria bacterium]|nr:CpsD/CapB family tyrosine-protein kinase [Deltaproteobacteria bacterium]